jgi:predicted  nucleic acid-binding Zn-ribbon protein
MKNHKCSKCGHNRFKTAKKEQGIRKQVRCRKCDHVQDVVVVSEAPDVVANKVPEV